jgi:ankyrin repeat protein
VDLLLANGAEVNAKNDRGFTALHVAAYFNHLEVVALLVAKGARVNDKSDAK